MSGASQDIQDVTETLTVVLDSGTDTGQADLQQVSVKLSEHRGINSVHVNEPVSAAAPDQATLVVEYNPFVISEEAVYDRIQASGLTIHREPSRKPGILRRFIDRLAEDNRQSFGSAQLDCCDLNKSNRPGR